MSTERIVDDLDLFTRIAMGLDEGSESVGWLDGWAVGRNRGQRSSYQKIRKQLTDIVFGFFLFVTDTREGSERMALITSTERIPDLFFLS